MQEMKTPKRSWVHVVDQESEMKVCVFCFSGKFDSFRIILLLSRTWMWESETFLSSIKKEFYKWQYIYALSIYVFVTLHVWMVMMMKGLGYSIILPDSCVSHSSYSLIVDWWLRTKTKTTKGKKNILDALRKKKSRWIKNENKKYWLRCEVWGGPITQYCYWQTGN